MPLLPPYYVSITVSGPPATTIQLTDGATITWDVAAQPSYASVTLEGNRTLVMSNLSAGMSGVLEVNQDDVGGRSLTLPANSLVANDGGGAVTLTSTANAKDVLAWYYNGEDILWTHGANFT